MIAFMADRVFAARRGPVVPPGEMEIYARDMTASIAADVSLDEVQRRLAEVGQWLPIDGDSKLSVGQLVAENSTGPLRLGFGAWRDLLLGCQFTNGRGELISTGGRVVKNVAGYDLTKLMVGQRGVLGKIVTITTRTYRRPTGALLAKFSPDVLILNRLFTTSMRPHWAILTASELVLGYVGDDLSLEYWQRSLAAHSPSPVEMTRQSLAEANARRSAVFRRPQSATAGFRASVPPMRIRDFIERVRPTNWAADAAFGIVIGGCPEEHANRWVEQHAIQLGGSAIFDVFGHFETPIPPGVLNDVLTRLKAAFDPGDVLTPLLHGAPFQDV